MPQTKLKEQETNQMIKLEQLFHNRYLTAQFLHQLVSIYVKAIQTFSGQYNFMRVYFMDKMQFVLTCPQIIKMLEGGDNIAESIRETIRMTQRPIEQKKAPQPKVQAQSENKRDPNQKKNEKDQPEQIHRENHHYHHERQQHHYYHYDESRNAQKGLKIDMKMKIMREVQQNMKNIHNQVNEADRKLVQKQEKIKDITKNQDKKFNQRLQKRKNRKRNKSVKLKVNKQQNQQNEVQPEPVIKKQQLKQAQRQLTNALIKFTIRMTSRQQANQKPQILRGDGMKKVKKARNIEEDQMLLQQNEENQEQKHSQIKQQQKAQVKAQKVPQVRAKTKRRNLDSDDD